MATHESFFQRYQSDEPQALARKIEEDYQELASTRATGDDLMQLRCLSSLGSRLTIAGQEDLAAPLLEQALALSRQLNEKQLEVATLLHLATAQQYLGRRNLAQDLFQEALDKARAYEQPEYADFILHHRGRCFVEQGKLTEARACFEQALLLRKQKGNQRGIVATQSALDALQSMEELLEQ
ncbi:tetratricopeptide repeat protein [Ktedonobacter racemifer]|uniref:Tetratricopeptide TPR_2 repeat protein n=1 Tax=Ktedonobacter racemifer DSM 44963 TaxID=485913 RepID=D6TTY4_KTERA|nr:tetratricopeptide repeat protein [Ktedonobacter racemifer]EFH83885.1 Tetratricopeptide TPR_2 repeat protein [Ktedonobacter racemifer DSM 44963]